MPHIAIPLRRASRPDGSRGLALHEQDSPEEVTACVFAVLNTRVGHRIDLPEFGTEGQAHRRGGADVAGLARAVALWEPRASVELLREASALQRLALESESLDVVRVLPDGP